MMRALYSAATGMEAQQLNMDVISNNLANVNTTGFKGSRAEFQDLLYQEIQPAGATVAQGAQRPVPIEVGLGVQTGSTETMFSEGNMQNTGNQLDVAISGPNGFYQVLLPDGTTGYTRDGSFKMDSEGNLVNSNGYQIQPQITIPANATNISIGADGTVSATVPGSTTPSTLGQLKLATFPNPAGLSQIGGNNFAPTAASGTPSVVTPGTSGTGTLSQGNLEMSNVQIVQEMVNMITAQRAYEVNSKAISTADSMLSTANNMISTQ